MWRMLVSAVELKRFGILLGLGLVAIVLSNCSAGNNIASNFGIQPAKETAVQQTKISQKTVAFANLVGVPPEISANMLTKVKQAARAKSINVTDEITRANFLIRGYLIAAPRNDGAKLSYIWDINNRQGTRIHRILGNQLIKGAKSSNGWSLVDNKVITELAETSAGKLRGWMAGQSDRQPVQQRKPDDLSTPRNISPVAKRKDGTPGDPVITGAVGKSTKVLFTHVSPVSGAPGDGRISLTNALRRELKKNGLKLSSRKIAGSYTVKGGVRLKRAGQGRQKVSIVWKVFDEKGNRIGTVSQNNIVPEGSLDGAWGSTAEAAASAAAKGIAKLLPSKK